METRDESCQNELIPAQPSSLALYSHLLDGGDDDVDDGDDHHIMMIMMMIMVVVMGVVMVNKDQQIIFKLR